jgi:hypothetical protein
MSLMNADSHTQTRDSAIQAMRASTLRAMRATTADMTLAATQLTLDAYADVVRWLETYPLTHFLTLTFGNPTGEDAAVRRVLQWHDAIEWLSRSPIGLVYGLEMSPELHVHGVLVGHPKISIVAAEHLWRDMAGDGQVERYDRAQGGVAYSLKEAFWTGRWGVERLEYYSPEGRQRPPVDRRVTRPGNGAAVPATEAGRSTRVRPCSALAAASSLLPRLRARPVETLLPTSLGRRVWPRGNPPGNLEPSNLPGSASC